MLGDTSGFEGSWAVKSTRSCLHHCFHDMVQDGLFTGVVQSFFVLVIHIRCAALEQESAALGERCAALESQLHEVVLAAQRSTHKPPARDSDSGASGDTALAGSQTAPQQAAVDSQASQDAPARKDKEGTEAKGTAAAEVGSVEADTAAASSPGQAQLLVARLEEELAVARATAAAAETRVEGLGERVTEAERRCEKLTLVCDKHFGARIRRCLCHAWRVVGCMWCWVQV